MKLSALTCVINNGVYLLTLNRVDKSNAFDDVLLREIDYAMQEAKSNPSIRVVQFKANGPNFCAGADLEWMKKMAEFSETDNINDAAFLAKVMYEIAHCPKPTVASVHGAAFGGGAGIVAACDIAIAADNAKFCFSEVRLGLIPAVISPYVIRCIGERASRALFLTAEVIEAEEAHRLQLVNKVVPHKELESFSLNYAQHLAKLPQGALSECKKLIHEVSTSPIDENLLAYTAKAIAKRRVSEEGQQGIQAFLRKMDV